MKCLFVLGIENKTSSDKRITRKSAQSRWCTETRADGTPLPSLAQKEIAGRGTFTFLYYLGVEHPYKLLIRTTGTGQVIVS